MSSAVRTTPTTSSSLQHSRLNSTYPLEVFKVLSPIISRLRKELHPKTVATKKPFQVNGQLIEIYVALGNARKALESKIPTSMLQTGRKHLFFKSTRQPQQGDWIKEVYDLVHGIESRIRKNFREPTDAVTLRNDIATNAKAKALSLPRLLAVFARFDPMSGEIATRPRSPETQVSHDSLALSA